MQGQPFREDSNWTEGGTARVLEGSVVGLRLASASDPHQLPSFLNRLYVQLALTVGSFNSFRILP